MPPRKDSKNNRPRLFTGATHNASLPQQKRNHHIPDINNDTVTLTVSAAEGIKRIPPSCSAPSGRTAASDGTKLHITPWTKRTGARSGRSLVCLVKDFEWAYRISRVGFASCQASLSEQDLFWLLHANV